VGWRRHPIPGDSPAVSGQGGAQELNGGVRNSNEALEEGFAHRKESFDSGTA
jgi:hypothetical protein